jgi:hypothetical protein
VTLSSQAAAAHRSRANGDGKAIRDLPDGAVTVDTFMPPQSLLLLQLNW